MPNRPFARPTAVFLAALLACQPADSGQGEADGEGSPEAGVVQVTARDFAFAAPEEIPSGWTTFRFENVGQQEHFVLLWRLPEGRTFDDYRTQVAGTFSDVWDRYQAGELNRDETVQALGEELPPWYFEEIVASGGAALTEAGESARATVNLEPGSYVMECYVKSPEGDWHSELGMLRQLTVTETPTAASPPEADAELTLSNYQIETSGELTSGTNTIAVHVTDTPEGFVPHDVNLFRLDDETTVEEIVEWMDWMDLEQFRAPAPGHSLGGVEHLPAGSTGYMTVDLEPGRYAWVSEGYGARGMTAEFTVE